MESNKKLIEYSLPGKMIKLKIIEDVEDLITDPNDPDKIPCWAEIWPAARAMALQIWENMDLKNKHVLELGCGLGLPGVVAGLKGANVTFSDFKSEAINLALENAKLNNLEHSDTYLGDWRNFKLDKKYDLILASDICYDPDLNEYLENIFTKNLKQGGLLLISHPKRPDTLRMLERLKENKTWNETVYSRSMTVEDSILPYYVIYINQLVYE